VIRYRIPIIGAILRRRADRRFGRQLADAFQQGTGSVTPGIIAAVHEAMTRPAPGYEEIANEGGVRWHQRTDPDDGSTLPGDGRR
jgi:hypothetical protein